MSVISGSFNTLFLVKVEVAALCSCLNPGVIARKETNDKKDIWANRSNIQWAERENMHLHVSSLKKGWWQLCPLQSLPNLDFPTLSLSARFLSLWRVFSCVPPALMSKPSLRLSLFSARCHRGTCSTSTSSCVPLLVLWCSVRQTTNLCCCIAILAEAKGQLLVGQEFQKPG